MALGDLVGRLRRRAQDLASGLAGGAEDLAGGITGGLGDALSAAADVLDRFGSGAASAASAATTVAGRAAGSLEDLAGGLASGAGDALSAAGRAASGLEDLASGITSGVGDALSAAREVLGRYPALAGATIAAPPGLREALAVAGRQGFAGPMEQAVEQRLRQVREGSIPEKALALIGLPGAPFQELAAGTVGEALGIERQPGELPTQALHRAVSGVDNPLARTLARAGEIAVLTASDPVQWALAALTGGGSLAAGGLGAFARAEGIGLAKMALLSAAGEEAGGKVAEALGKDEAAGRLVGGLAAPVAGGMALRRLEEFAPAAQAKRYAGVAANWGMSPPEVQALDRVATRLVKDPRLVSGDAATVGRQQNKLAIGPLRDLGVAHLFELAPNIPAGTNGWIKLRVVGRPEDLTTAEQVIGVQARPRLWEVEYVPGDTSATAQPLLPSDFRRVADAARDVAQARLQAGTLASAYDLYVYRDAAGRVRLAIGSTVPGSGVAQDILREALDRAGVTFRQTVDPASLQADPAVLRRAIQAVEDAHDAAVGRVLALKTTPPSAAGTITPLGARQPPPLPPVPPTPPGPPSGAGGAGDLLRLAGSPIGRTALGAGLGALAGAGEAHQQGEDTGGILERALTGAALGAGLGFASVPLVRGAATLFWPALRRDRALNDVITRYGNEVTNLPGTEAAIYRNRLEPAVQALQEEIDAGRVVETPERQQLVDALKQAAVSPEAAQRIDQARLAIPVIREDPNGFVLSPRARQALDQIDQAYKELEDRALASGLLTPDQLAAHYQNRLWQVPPAGGVGPARTLGRLPAFARQRVFNSILHGIAVGAEPATLDPLELVAQRVRDQVRAEAQVRLLERLAEHPEWWAKPPAGAATPGATSGAVPLTEATLATLAPDVPAAARRALARQLAERAVTTGVVRSSARPLALSPEVAKAVEAAVAPGPTGDAWNAVNQVMGGTRFIALGTDIAQFLRVTPGAFFEQLAGEGPLEAVGSMARALRAAVRGKDFQDLLLSQDQYDASGRLVRPGWMTVARYVPQLAPDEMRLDLIRDEARRLWVEKLPGAGLIERLERWQFGRLMPAVTYETVADIYQNLRRSAKFAHLSDEELLAQIGDRIGTVTSGVSRYAAGISAAHEQGLRALLVSPAWTRGIVKDVAGVAQGGVQGYIARRAWLSFLATAGALAVLGSWALSDDHSLDTLIRLADPTRPDSVTNPSSPYFLAVKLPDGGAVTLWGPRMPAVRAIARTAQNVVRRLGESDPTLWLVPEVAGAILSPDVTEPLRTFFERKQSIPLSNVRAVMENRDFLGRPIATSDDPLVRLGQRLIFAAANILPQSVSNLVAPASDTSALPASPGEVPLSQRLIGSAAAFLGANYISGPNDPGWVKDKIESFLQSQGESGGGDPVRALRTLPLSRLAVQRFLAENPDVAAYLDQERAQRAAMNLPVGEDAARAYTTLTGQARVQRDQALRAAGDALMAGQISGDEYRKRVRDAWDAYVGAARAAAGLYLGTTDLNEAQAKIDATYAKSGRARAEAPSELDRLYEQYEAIRVPENGTPEQVEAALAARRQFLREHPELVPALVDLARARGGEAYARYVQAQQAAGGLAEIPTYLGLDAAVARQASRLVQKGRDLMRFVPGLSLETAVLLAAGPDDKPLLGPALLIAMRALPVNPARRQYQMAHAAELAPFYSNLLMGDIERLMLGG